MNIRKIDEFSRSTPCISNVRPVAKYFLPDLQSRIEGGLNSDTALIEHLMDRMSEQGYRNLACAEARSTYGVFFTNREHAI